MKQSKTSSKKKLNLNKFMQTTQNDNLKNSAQSECSKTNNQPQKNLIEQVDGLFVKENKVNSSEFKICGNQLKVFYVSSLVDSELLSSGLLSPLAKLASKQNENQQPTNQSEDTQSKTKSQEKQSINTSQKQTDGENKNAKQDPAASSSSNENSSSNKMAEMLKSQVLTLSSLKEVCELQKIKDSILAGSAVIVWNSSALVCPLFAPEKRTITEPPNSKVIHGPREGFVEDLSTNEGLIRKRLQTENLHIIDLFVGKQTKSKVEIFYLDGIAKPEVVEMVKAKLSTINIDAIIDSYYLESFLESNKLKFFRRVGNTEKPDILCAKILEGRVGIMVEGSPVALTVPFMIFEDLQSVEDYYNIPSMATFTRMIRIIGLIFALLAPGIYVALQSYNYRILPINFLITLLSSIEGLSIPPLVEILIVLFLFEIITEASLRMPNSLSMALSIIGALALGNTAVDAGIISPPSIVIVAISSVALYIIPDQISQTRMLRTLFTAIGGIIGLYGIITSFIILTCYMCLISSFGVPYLTPFAPNIKQDKKDGFVKQSIQDMRTRPELLADKNKTRQKEEEHDC